MNYIFRILFILVIFNIINGNVSAQLTNYNANIKVNTNAYIKGQNLDFINKSDGVIDNDGSIILKGGNWLNKSNNNVFSNYNQNGEVRLTGTNEQIIGGDNRTVFESLTISNGDKKLDLNNTEVRNKLDLNNDGVLKLNLHRIIVNNNSTEAVTADAKSYILSENIDNDYNEDTHNDNVYGELQWNIGTAKGNYIIPFGNKDGDKLDLTMNVKTSGSPDWGTFVFATYPANSLNYPLASSIGSLDELNPTDVADRYWKIQAIYDNKPNVNLKFQFSPNDIAQERNPGLSPVNLFAIRYNPSKNTWLDREATGSTDAATHTVNTPDVNAADLFDWWTLATRSKLETTDVFTPNNDGYNDVFIPQFNKDKSKKYSEGLTNIEGKIFNRWGNKIYDWKGENWWDGKFNGTDVSDGTYFYIITAKGIDGISYNKKGAVALIRK